MILVWIVVAIVFRDVHFKTGGGGIQDFGDNIFFAAKMGLLI